MSMDIINRLESEVRGYVRSFPTEFKTARGNRMTDVQGREYLDFFSGAGALNYGHNDPDMEAALLEYIKQGGINHGLDMATEAKTRFMETFEEVILKPRNLDYKFQFPGPTGTNAVEAALKLARKYTGRSGMIHFTHSFHGMTLGSTSVTSNAAIRNSAGVGLSDTTTARVRRLLSRRARHDHGSGSAAVGFVLRRRQTGGGDRGNRAGRRRHLCGQLRLAARSGPRLSRA